MLVPFAAHFSHFTELLKDVQLVLIPIVQLLWVFSPESVATVWHWGFNGATGCQSSNTGAYIGQNMESLPPTSHISSSSSSVPIK